MNRTFAALLLVVASLGAATLAFLLAPAIPYAITLPQVDLILSTAAVVLAGAAASRAWIRYEEATEDDGLFQASAMLVLIVGGVLRLLVIGADRAPEFGYSTAAPGQAPLIVWTLTRGIASVLLLIAALAALRRWRRPRPAASRVWLFTPAVAALAVSALVLSVAQAMPAFVPLDRLARLIEPGSVIDTAAIWLPWAFLQLAIGGIFATAALGFAVVAARSRRPGYPGFVAAGLIAAAFMDLHVGIVPGPYAGSVNTSDLLSILFYGLVLAGVGAATRADLVDLAAANRDLERLRDAENRRVLADERARMAREVHDGLVQDIWLARLTGGQLSDIPDLPAEAKAIVGRVDTILEGALAEAREVVLALQPDASGDFADLLAKFVTDYSDRFGVDIDLTVNGSAPRLPADVQRELVRICREALNNTRKHADATLVRVALESTDDTLRLTLSDNGSGFDPAGGPHSPGFGLRSMSERAAKIGARLEIDSAPMDGTRVTVELDTTANARAGAASDPGTAGSQ